MTTDGRTFGPGIERRFISSTLHITIHGLRAKPKNERHPFRAGLISEFSCTLRAAQKLAPLGEIIHPLSPLDWNELTLHRSSARKSLCRTTRQSYLSRLCAEQKAAVCYESRTASNFFSRCDKAALCLILRSARRVKPHNVPQPTS